MLSACAIFIPSLSITLGKLDAQGKKAYKICQNYQTDQMK
ncbi:hypothetical protein HMPREF0023_2578 [Acinetobacter sp. ATCC 27244]|nr:hypothetical protein HMPREF0023_2578 [Acinetobacter sp. ATCC 27244]